MATQEKLLKSLESLKHLINFNLSTDPTLKKKEKIHHCNFITEAISSSTIKIAPNFTQLLGVTFEILLQLCDDQESDIRMVADESLNRIIKAMNNGNVSKVQIELHKEIKKNGAARSLRAALWRFSKLANQIKPHKGKPYVFNLFPCIVRITERSEEFLHETLMDSLPKIMQTLGCFTTDNDIKMLLGAFLKNVSSSSTVVRRTTASCILTVCLNCKKPSTFLMYVLNNLIDMLVSVEESSSYLLLGVMGCLKIIIPHFKHGERGQEIQGSFGVRKEINETPVTTDKFLQVYDICLYYLSYNDHNVINVSLETLIILLQNSNIDLRSILLSPNGIPQTKISFQEVGTNLAKSPLGEISTQREENISLDSELTDTLKSEIEKWIDQSKLSVINVNYVNDLEKSTDSTDTVSSASFKNVDEYSNISIGSILDNYAESVQNESVNENSGVEKNIFSENSSERSFYQHADETDSLTTITDICIQDVDIGSYKDKSIPLVYCTRLITKLFLLTGQPNVTISDKRVRVSVKNLALTCLSSIFQIYPDAFLLHLDKNCINGAKHGSKQLISDVLLFVNHPDPQLRGVIRILLASFLKAVLIECGGNYDNWIGQRSSDDVYEFKKLIGVISKGLEDESSQCTRQTLTSLGICLKYIIESYNSLSAVLILNVLPVLSTNPYWLVKVKLLEVISELHYVTIEHVTGSQEFQNKIIYNILFYLLKDDDQRVRLACSNAIINIIPNLYFEHDTQSRSTITNKAIYYKRLYLSSLYCPEVDTNINKKNFITSMPFPYNSQCMEDNIEAALSRIISKLHELLLTSTSKHLIYGCIETLCLLSRKYPSTLYKSSWNCFKNYNVQHEKTIFQRSSSIVSNMPILIESSISSSNDLLNISVSLFAHVMAYDLNCHANLLKFSGNIFAGKCVENLQQTRCNVVDAPRSSWDMFDDKNLQDIAEKFLNHVVKMLNIFCHIIDEVIPITIPTKPVIPNLPPASSLSPLKRRKSDLEKSKLSPGKATEKEDKSEKKGESAKVNSMGYFANIPHYIKIYEILRTAYLNYKITLDSEACENFLVLLDTTLRTLSQIFEIATLTEISRISEETLHYLRATFQLDPTASVDCVHQLLKSLFGTNLTLNTDVLINKNRQAKNVDNREGFYYNMSQIPYNDISLCINSLTQANKIECDGDNTVMGYLHRKENKKPITKGSDKILANYIRIFEPMVIKSLKQYTTTSNIKLQCSVLQLLSQLVLLRVNYCLLDSDQIFIGFVMKQFEFIEDGQIQLAEELIPKIFQFLVHLSYGKQHSKSIISVPKIIQLCDGLMASGQSPLTHCIPALQPIVEDIFLMRSKSNTVDFQELETTREVLLSMLLRLFEYHQIIDLLVLILNESKYCGSSEKWSRWSKQVFDVFLMMLKLNKIRLDDFRCVNSIKKLILVLNPAIFRPVDELLISLFQEPPNLGNPLILINRWLGKVTFFLLILLQTKEDILLMKISQCAKEFSPKSIIEDIILIPDPLNVTNIFNYFEGMTPEFILVKFIFRVISITSQRCLHIAQNEPNDFLIEQLSHYLMLCLYIFQSGCHCKVTNVAMNLTDESSKHRDKISLDDINSNFQKLAVFFPLLTYQWCCILTVLNYSNRTFWASIIGIKETYGIIKHIQEPAVISNSRCINVEIVKTGGFIAFCEYLVENISDPEQLAWFVINSIELIINLCEEPPVHELIAAIHRSPAGSGLFIESILSLDNIEPTFITKIVKCVENVHSLQSGALLNLFIPKLLDSRQLSVSRLVANLASRKIEYLLTLSMEEVTCQLPREDLVNIMDVLVSKRLAKKNETLICLLNKLSSQFYDLSPLELDQRRTINPEYIKKLQIHKNWYIQQIKMRCHLCSCGSETAQLLCQLEYDDIVSVMCSKDFNKITLKDCIKYSTNLLQVKGLKEHPLLTTSINILLQDVVHIKSLLPKPHQVYKVVGREQMYSEQKYSHRLTELFADDTFWNYLFSLLHPITAYIKCLSTCPTLQIPENNLEDLIKFSIVCLESINYTVSIQNVNINFMDTALNCVDVILQNKHLHNKLALDAHISWLCSAVNSIYKLVSHMLLNFEPLPILPKNMLKTSLETVETMSAGQACYQLSTLIVWIEKKKKSSIPNFLYIKLKSIITSLARLPLVNSYILTPPSAWKNGWTVELNGPYKTHVPPLPIEYLQEIEVLEEFIFRITLLGWTSRQQFEETWMCLLSVLSYSPNENNIPEEVNAIVHATSLAVRAITSLLVFTLYDPHPGNRNNSKLIHVPRDSAINDKSAAVRKLKLVQEDIQSKLNEHSSSLPNTKPLSNVFSKSNLEKQHEIYTCGQMSVEYLLISSRIVNTVDENNTTAQLYKRREKILSESGLDLNSCLQFLLDLYSQWFKLQSSTPLRILNEVVKSVLIISDLFVEKAQYSWMLDTFLELCRTHIIEDDIIHQYLIIGMCKAAAVISPDMETFEHIKKCLTQGLKSAFLSARIGSLHGILYLLQGCILGNTIIGGVSDEMHLFLPLAVEYVQCHININNSVLNQSQDHNLLLWSLAFFLIENVYEIYMDPQFSTTVIQSAVMVLNAQKHVTAVHNSIMKGLERLVIKKCLSGKLCDQITKLSLEKIKDSNPVYALAAVQLLISCMYTECAEQLENTEKSNGIIQSNPDNLVQTIEKVSAIFDRIKKGYPFEVEVLCYILPRILNDFFPPSDILTKVVGEFLSPQQRHPKLLSSVVFQVFESAINQSQLSLLQDWVVFSLTNFTQSFPIGMATWCLTCFFISASTNNWLRSLFPYVQSRIGRYEYEDRKILCIAGVDFYKNLTSDKQKETFVETFSKVKHQTDMQYNDLLASL